MKEWRVCPGSFPARFLPALLVVSCLVGQGPGKGAAAERDVAAIEAQLKRCLDVDGNVGGLAQSLLNLLEVLGTGAEADAVRFVVDGLHAQKEPGPLPRETVAQAIEALAKVRKGARLAWTLPVIELLLRQEPNDMRLIFCRGEAYGRASAVFNGSKALLDLQALEQELLSLAGKGGSQGRTVTPVVPNPRVSDLLAFLPEVAVRKQSEQIPACHELLCRMQRPLRNGLAVDAADESGGRQSVDDRLRKCFADARDGLELKWWLDDLCKELGSGSDSGTPEVLEDLGNIGLVVESLASAKRAQKAELDDKTATKLLDQVERYRRTGRLRSMLTALVLFQNLRQDEPLVLYALGEAYGTQSPFFQPERALEAFNKLTDQLAAPTAPTKRSPEAQYRVLFESLPELSGGDQVGRLDWFRRKVGDFCEVLRRGEAISLWSLRDPRLEELQEDLIVAMRSADNEEILAILGTMLSIHSEDPGTLFLRAKVYASLGSFDPKKGAKDLERFLEITSEAKFESNVDEDPRMGRQDVARRLKSMSQFTAKDDLQELRIEAKEIQKHLSSNGGKSSPRLFYPDRGALDREIENRNKSQTELAELEKRIADCERKMENAKRAYQQWQARDRQLRKGLSDPQPYLDEIQKWNNSLKQSTRKRDQALQKMEVESPTLEELLEARQKLDGGRAGEGRRRR